MQPETPPNANQPMPQNSPLSKPPRKKTTFTIVIIIVALLVVALIVGLVVRNINSNQSNQNDTSVYYDRAGYPRASLGKSIGDPLALTMTAQHKTQTLSSGLKIIPACSVVTMDDLHQYKLSLYPNDFGTPIQQNYLSSTGKAAFAPDILSAPVASDTLSCSYGLTDSQTVSITVNQSFTATKAAVDYSEDALGFTSPTIINGWTVTKRTKDNETNYLMRKGTDAVMLRLKLKDTSMNDTIVASAIKHLNDFESTPTGISDITYTSPTFTDTFAKSCDYTTNDDMKQLTGYDMSPLVQERWATSTGVITSKKDGDKKSNYVRNQCVRTANIGGDNRLIGTTTHTIQVTATTYENDKAASDGLLQLSVGDGNENKIKGTGVGDETYAYKSIGQLDGGQNTLAFRKGRVVIEIVYDFAQQDKDPTLSDLNTYPQKVSPLADAIAAKLTHF